MYQALVSIWDFFPGVCVEEADKCCRVVGLVSLPSAMKQGCGFESSFGWSGKTSITGDRNKGWAKGIAGTKILTIC